MSKIEENSIQPNIKLQEFAKIPKHFPTEDKHLVRAYSVYACLKQFKYNGSLHYFARNRQFYADHLGICPKTLHTRIRELIALDWARWEGKTLQLNSYKHVWRLVLPHKPVVSKTGEIVWRRTINGVIPQTIIFSGYYKIAGTLTKGIEDLLYLFAIYNNFKRQKYEIEKKIIAYEAAELAACDKHGLFTNQQLAELVKRASQRTGERGYSKLAKHMFKHGYEAAWMRHDKVTIHKLQHQLEFPAINTRITLSCSGFARVAYGKANKSTGYYLQQRLINRGYIHVARLSVRASENLGKEAGLYEPLGVYGCITTRPFAPKSYFRTLENGIAFHPLLKPL